SAVVVEPFSDRGNVAHGDTGRLRWRASTLSSGAALEASPARVAGLGRRLPSRAAGRSAARARAARARPLELERLRQRRPAPQTPFVVGRAGGGTRIPPVPAQGASRAVRRVRRYRRRFRCVGFIDSGRVVRHDPRRCDGGGAWRRTTAVPVSDLAEAAGG